MAQPELGITQNKRKTDDWILDSAVNLLCVDKHLCNIW
jgi:hypothetical protein